MYITTYRTVSYAIPHNYLSKTKHINGGKGAIVKKYSYEGHLRESIARQVNLYKF